MVAKGDAPNPSLNGGKLELSPPRPFPRSWLSPQGVALWEKGGGTQQLVRGHLKVQQELTPCKLTLEAAVAMVSMTSCVCRAECHGSHPASSSGICHVPLPWENKWCAATERHLNDAHSTKGSLRDASQPPNLVESSEMNVSWRRRWIR